MIKADALTTFVGRVKRGAEIQQALGTPGWTVETTPQGRQLGQDDIRGYRSLCDDAVHRGEVAEAIITNDGRCLEGHHIRRLWTAATTEGERLLVRTLSLTRVLLSRPSEILLQQAPSPDDLKADTSGALGRRRTDGEGLAFMTLPTRHIKVGGRRHLTVQWSDPRKADPAGALDPCDAGRPSPRLPGTPHSGGPSSLTRPGTTAPGCFRASTEHWRP